MSRLDKIKARADAATKGPWLQDGPWWTDDGGPEPTALPCVVDVDRALVVFPPDATDVGMKRPEDRAANMAFIAAAREDVPWLIERIGELIGAICWDTTCLNCSSLLDSNYDQYMRAEIAEAEVTRLTAERDALAAQVAEGVHLTDVWASDLATDAMVNVMDGVALEAINEQLKRLLDLRDALAGGSYGDWMHAHVVEVARAAETAVLGAIAGDWLIERTYGLSDEGIKGWPETNANAYRCAIEDAQSALRERADELTDTDDRSK